MVLLEQLRLQHIASWLDNNPDGSFCGLYEGTYVACERELETLWHSRGSGFKCSEMLYSVN